MYQGPDQWTRERLTETLGASLKTQGTLVTELSALTDQHVLALCCGHVLVTAT